MYFSHLFVLRARNRTEGEPIPYCSKLPARNTFKTGVLPVSITTESIKFPAQNTFIIGVLQLQQTRAGITTARAPAVAFLKLCWSATCL